MDSASRRVIEHAPLVLVDFDRTLATLRTDWAALKARLASACEGRGWPWEIDGPLDRNLRRVRADVSENAFLLLCRMVANAEIAGFDANLVSRELIEILRDRAGYATAIVTNNTNLGVSRILANPVFRGVDARIIGKEDVTRSKPDPQGLLRACQLFVASPKATVFVGDSDTDALAAKAAGIGIFVRVERPAGPALLRLAA